MKPITEAAINYLEKYNFSVIPLRVNKLPWIQWLPYQKRKPTKDEIMNWFERKFPRAMLGIITGEISNLTIVDIDTEEGKHNIEQIFPSNFISPTVKTPNGKHLYCLYTEGLRSNARAIPGTDLRSQGGYVVVPPSVSLYGKKYEWVEGYELDTVPLPNLPDTYVESLLTGRRKIMESRLDDAAFVEGRRDDDLFHVANTLMKGGMGVVEAKIVVKRLAGTCDPPFSEPDALVKVDSAFTRLLRSEDALAVLVRDWINGATGIFHIREVYMDLGITDRGDKQNTYMILKRLRDEEKIEKYGDKHGVYRVLDKTAQKMVLGKKRNKTVDIKMPMELHDLVTLYPGNMIVIAGDINAGKTAWLLNFIKLNMDKHEIHYFNSESGEEEFEDRLLLFKDISLDDWNFTAWERSSNFPDLMKTAKSQDAINVIDFLEIYDDFWKVGGMLKDIHDTLGKGLAVIALQKSKFKQFGRGMEFSGEKPRLYLAMGSGRITIVKAKSWKTNENPNGMIHDFKLVNGSEFIPMGFWRRLEEKDDF